MTQRIVQAAFWAFAIGLGFVAMHVPAAFIGWLVD